MSDESPRIVSLPVSFDLAEFPSEEETVETASAPAPALESAPAPQPMMMSTDGAIATTLPVASESEPVVPAPEVEVPLFREPLLPPIESLGVTREPASSVVPLDLEASRPARTLDIGPALASAAAAAATPASSEPHTAKPATITEFPVQTSRPAAALTPELVPAAVTLVDLLERQGGLDWRRAVAVMHQICLQLKDQPTQAPILLEARNIVINHEGDVRLLPGKTGGDPLVIQLGRLLRTMLMGNDAPPELRLLLAQATFELPIFESVEEVDRALKQLERIEETAGDGTGFQPPVAEPPPPPVQEPYTRQAPRSILPAHKNTRRSKGRVAPVRSLASAVGSRLGAALVIVAIVIAVVLIRPTQLFPRSSDTAIGSEAVAAIEPPVPTSGNPNPPADPAPAIGTPPSHRAANRNPVSPDRNSRGSSSSSSPGLEAPLLERPTNVVVLPGRTAAPVAGTASVTGTRTIVPSPRESERRATELIAQGQTAEAAMLFDSLVQSSPLYEPKSTDLTPEALAAFRTSQRQLLPLIAQRGYERARAVLNAGDPERALALTRDVNAILDRPSVEPLPQLREQVRELIEAATAAQAIADAIVYSEADSGVVPPRPLSPQFPLKPPAEVPPHRVGTLEMIINKQGGVENVKLHTPLNRYHERMIVSAAKAWRYRPATKDGRPVNYRVIVRINLPESGTDY